MSEPCPRCGATTAAAPECPACGVILAKARPLRARPAPLPAPPAAWRSLVLPGLGLAVLVVVAVVHLRRAPAPAASPSDDAPRARTVTSPPPAIAPPPVAAAVPVPDVVPETLADPSASEVDRETAERLVRRLQARAALAPDDVRAAEELFARHEAPARDLLEAVLLQAAAAHRDGRRFAEADQLLRRAAAIAPSSPRPPKALLAVYLQTGDWAAAEAAGRSALALDPGDGEATRGVAYALLRQDRSPEAVELLALALESHPDPETRRLLDRLRRDRGTEAALDVARLAHFNVRYDGEAHEDVGREVLRLLDRHYATLVRTFDHEPAAAIPVILLSRESYYDATGAPAWSGGQYDLFDGRVRIPIGGLTVALAPELDGTLVHELTHAFVAEMSRGVAPREIHEGLAQRMEGKRAEAVGEEALRALARGRLPGVAGFYLSALSFTDDLAAQRGQGGLNDLLRAMAETGDRDEAFRRVYGKPFAALLGDWADRLRRRHGG